MNNTQHNVKVHIPQPKNIRRTQRLSRRTRAHAAAAVPRAPCLDRQACAGGGVPSGPFGVGVGSEKDRLTLRGSGQRVRRVRLQRLVQTWKEQYLSFSAVNQLQLTAMLLHNVGVWLDGGRRRLEGRNKKWPEILKLRSGSDDQLVSVGLEGEERRG